MILRPEEPSFGRRSLALGACHAGDAHRGLPGLPCLARTLPDALPPLEPVPLHQAGEADVGAVQCQGPERDAGR